MVPPRLCCPITGEVFRHPVVASDGRTYELDAIREHVMRGGTSPFTRAPLNPVLYPNVQAVEDVNEWAAQHGGEEAVVQKAVVVTPEGPCRHLVLKQTDGVWSCRLCGHVAWVRH